MGCLEYDTQITLLASYDSVWLKLSHCFLIPLQWTMSIILSALSLHIVCQPSIYDIQYIFIITQTNPYVNHNFSI
jgi:hypothetical protein